MDIKRLLFSLKCPLLAKFVVKINTVPDRPVVQPHCFVQTSRLGRVLDRFASNFFSRLLMYFLILWQCLVTTRPTVLCHDLFLYPNLVNSERLDFCTCSHKTYMVIMVLVSTRNQTIHKCEESKLNLKCVYWEMVECRSRQFTISVPKWQWPDHRCR